MGMEITGNYSSYATQNMADSIVDYTKKADDTEKAKLASAAKDKKTKSTDNKKVQNNADYMNTLEKLAPSVKFGTGTSLSSAREGKTLNINSKLLEKMQNDSKTEKDMKDMIAGIETAMNISESVNKSLGMKTVYSHWYIDENGKCWHTGYYVSDDTMNKKLREERQKNSEKLIEKRKEKAKELRKEKQKALKEKKAEKADSEKSENTSDKSRAEQIIEDKIAYSSDGKVYYDSSETKELIDTIKEDGFGEAGDAVKSSVGVNFDIKA